MGDPAFTATFAAYVEALDYAHLTAPVVAMAKDVIADQLACQLACSELAHARKAIAYSRDRGGRAEATVIGTDFKTDIEHAALVNGILGHGDEIDGSLPGFGHAGAVLLPTVLAVGEAQGSSGRDLLVALVAGYEAAGRMAKAGFSLDGLAPRNFHQASTAGSVAAAVSASKLLGLNLPEIQAAIGLAAEQACGLQAMRNEPEHMNKSFHMGVGSRNGICAAYMAQLGYGGVLDVFDQPFSIFDAFVPEGSDPEALTRDLGSSFEILRARFKRYASGSPTHCAIAALHAIMSEQNINADDIEHIHVVLPTLEQKILSGRKTLNVNLEYIIAVAALDGQVAWEQYEEERTADPNLQDLWRRVTTAGDQRMDDIKESDELARPAQVTVSTLDGRTFVKEMVFPPGSPKNPLSQAELDEKFMTWSTRVVSDDQARRLKLTIETLDKLGDANELGDLLRV